MFFGQDIGKFILFLFFKDFIYLFLERGEGKEKERESNQYVVASCMRPTRDLAHNPVMCPDWKLNRRPFGSQASTQSTEPHQLGLFYFSDANETEDKPNKIYLPALPFRTWPL